MTKYLQRTIQSIFDTRQPLWRFCLRIVPVCLLPTFLLVGIALKIFTFFGIPIPPPEPSHSIYWEILFIIILIPILETYLLAAGLRILSKMISKRVAVASASSLIWGILHAIPIFLGFLDLFGDFSFYRTLSWSGETSLSKKPL